MAYVLVEKEKDFWATMFIVAGFLVKLYGITGLLFFVFSRHKIKFIFSFLFWMVVLVCLPMIISSPGFIIQSYKDWYEKLIFKNEKNIHQSLGEGMQDISALGMVRRIFSKPGMGNIYILAPAAAMIVLPLLRFKQYISVNYRMSYLAIVLISVVIFSSSAESSTYVVALAGCALWYIIHYQTNRRLANGLLIFIFLLTSLSATDLCPDYLKDHFIRRYALKALPVLIVWLYLIKDVAFSKFNFESAKPQLL